MAVARFEHGASDPGDDDELRNARVLRQRNAAETMIAFLKPFLD